VDSGYFFLLCCDSRNVLLDVETGSDLTNCTVSYFQFGYSHHILSMRLDLGSDMHLCVEGDNMNYDVS